MLKPKCVSHADSFASVAESDAKAENHKEVGEKAEKTEKKMSYDMQTQATELCNMSTQTDLPPIASQQPKTFSQSALRSGNLDAGKLISTCLDSWAPYTVYNKRSD